MIAADSSVAVPAALRWHRAHAVASEALTGSDPCLIAHVAVETFSTLTRLPRGQSVPAALALGYLRTTFPRDVLTLSADGHADLLDAAARAGISGGAVYDALVAATAREAGATLLTLDRRAIRTYAALGADYRLLA